MRKAHLWLLALVMTVRGTMIQKPSIAVIGGGIAGLSCAERLLQIDPTMAVTVFDTGKYEVGGRCSSRDRNDKLFPILSKSIYDHAAQVLAEPTDDQYIMFRQQLRKWEQEKVITEYHEGSIYSIDDKGNLKPKHIKAFYGSKGFGFIPKTMAQSIGDVRRDVWVSPSNGARRKNSKWMISSNGKQCGSFDRLVIAHNGKCADRLMSKTPAKDVHRLLQVNFNPNVPDNGGKRMTLNSLYSLTFALSSSDSPLSRRLPDSFVCGEFQHPILRFLTCQTRKYPRDDDVEVWTVLSSPQFAKKHKAPQEFLPDEVVETVTTSLINALETTMGISALNLLEKRLQLWGAAVPINTWQNGKGFIYDSENEVGVCGDWLLESNITGAWTSGQLLAEHMTQSASPATVGLEGKFLKSETAQQGGIASFPQPLGVDLSIQK